MKLNIKLGETMDHGAMPMSMESSEKEVYYPEFTFREEDKPEFPDEGTMVIRYVKTRTSHDKKAKKPYQCTIEVREIVSASGEENETAPTKTDREAERALDGLLEEKRKKSNPGNEDY